MHRTWAVLLLLVMIAAGGSHAADHAAEVEAEIRRLSEQERAAFLRHDVATLDGIFAEELVVTNPFNHFLNKQQVLKGVEARTISFSAFQRHLDYVRVYSDTVITAGRETFVQAGKMPNPGQSVELRITQVWLRRDGRWQQVARHTSIVAPR